MRVPRNVISISKAYANTHSHTIPLWYIYLYLVDFYGFHVGKYTNPHGCYGCYGIGAHLPISTGCGQSCCCNDGALNHGGHENGFRGDLPARGGPKVGP